MEITDELMTPGCPNCFIKHMSTALSYVAEHAPTDVVPRHDILLARAVINFTEVAEGYESHYYYAIGLVNRAEQEAVAENCPMLARELREIRSDIQGMTPERGSVEAVSRLAWRVTPGAYAAGHVAEANRELTVDSIVTACDPDGLVAAIRDVYNTYFSIPELPEKGGEETMACGKKKAAPKAAKAACKGGKCGGKKGCK